MNKLLLHACLVVCLILPASWAIGADAAAKDSAQAKKPAAEKTAEKTAEPVKKDSAPSAKKDQDKKGKSKKHAETASAEKKASAEKSAADQKKSAATAPAKGDAKSVAKTAAKKTAPEKKKAQAALFVLRGEYPEGPAPLNMFSDMQPSLHSLIERMDNAAEDSSIAAVVLQIEDLEIGLGKVNEICGAIARIRKAGKPTIALLGTAQTRQFLVASACDQVWMAPSGVLMLPGVRAEMMFYKGLFDKIGVEAEILQQGKFKGAGEPYTRNKMSPALRESIEALADDTYDFLAQTVGERRHCPDYRVKSLMDEGLFTAAAAQKAGLVDALFYEDQLADSLRKSLKVDEVTLLRTYKKKKVDADFSGLSGMMKFMEMMFGGGAKTAEKPTAQKKIAVVYAVGPIVEGKGSSSPFGNEQIIGSSKLVATLRSAAEDPKVVAVVLRVDSPGGSATGSDLIWRQITRMKKPVIASMGDVAGSGGYYIAMGTNKILAAPGTITGSIGVIGGRLALRKLYDKIGLSTDVVSRGRLSGVLSSTDPFTPEERKAWTGMLEETYKQFVTKAAQGRKMSYNELEPLAQGRVYTGRMAGKIRLVDGLGTLHDAIEEAKKAAKLKADEKVDIEILPEPKSFLERLFGDSGVSGEMESLVPELAPVLRQVRLMSQLFQESTLTLMPCQIKIK